MSISNMVFNYQLPGEYLVPISGERVDMEGRHSSIGAHADGSIAPTGISESDLRMGKHS